MILLTPLNKETHSCLWELVLKSRSPPQEIFEASHLVEMNLARSHLCYRSRFPHRMHCSSEHSWLAQHHLQRLLNMNKLIMNYIYCNGVKLEIAVGFSGAIFVFICSDNRCSILRTWRWWNSCKAWGYNFLFDNWDFWFSNLVSGCWNL